MVEGVTIQKYQVEFLKLTKKIFEEQQDLYQKAIIIIRLEELQSRGAYMVKCNKPTKNGTKITFRPTKDADEYKKQLDRIVEDGARLGITFEKKEE